MIYFLRHGIDDEGYVGGWSDAGLLEEGIEQIKKATSFIQSSQLEINKIYSSDIKRAVDSTIIANQSLKLPIVYDKSLRELNKGDLTGMITSEAIIKYQDFYNHVGIDSKYPNGESMIEFYERSKILLSKIMNNNYDKSLIVTHRGIINMIYYILNNIELDMDKKRFGVTHASIHELDIKKKVIRRIYG